MIMRTYRTIEGDSLDLICFKHYQGRQSGIVEQVLAANYRLSGQAAQLPAGLVINLPDIPQPKRDIKTISLWD